MSDVLHKHMNEGAYARKHNLQNSIHRIFNIASILNVDKWIFEPFFFFFFCVAIHVLSNLVSFLKRFVYGSPFMKINIELWPL